MKLKNLELLYVLLGGGWYSFSLKSKAAKCPKSIDPSSSRDGFRSSSISLSSNGWPLGIFIVFIPAQASSKDSLPLLSVSISSNFCTISAALLERRILLVINQEYSCQLFQETKHLKHFKNNLNCSRKYKTTKHNETSFDALFFVLTLILLDRPNLYTFIVQKLC